MHLLMLLAALWSPPTPLPGHGTLTLLVRDPAGVPLAGIALRLVRETDRDGWAVVATVSTTADGTAVIADLPWGMYAVQLVGPGMPPVAAQNQGALADGGGTAGGFGVQFVDAAHTERYVLLPDARGALTQPQFDMAAHDHDPPQPFDPQQLGPTPTPLTLRQALAARAPTPAPLPAPRGPADGWCLLGLAALLTLGALTMLLGWLRSRASSPAGRRPDDARLD